MIDAELIQQCADPSLKVEIVQKFIEEAGGADHLTVTVRAGERIILVPKPSTQVEAMQLIQQNLGQSIVRVGVTQYPAGFGIQDMSELSPDLLDSCKNIGMGTALFAKVYRIVLSGTVRPPRRPLRTRYSPTRPAGSRAAKSFMSPIPAKRPSLPSREVKPWSRASRRRPMTAAHRSRLFRRKTRTRPVSASISPESATTIKSNE